MRRHLESHCKGFVNKRKTKQLEHTAPQLLHMIKQRIWELTVCITLAARWNQIRFMFSIFLFGFLGSYPC